MKIGILTFANVPNFGANLQALSTVCFLQNRGVESVLIKWEPLDFEERFTAIRQQAQPKAHFDFVKAYLPQTEICRNDEDILRTIERENIDAVIIGSDAVLQHSSLLARMQFPTKSIFRITKITSERIYPNAFWGTFRRGMTRQFPMAMMSVSSQNSQYKLTSMSTRRCMCRDLSQFEYISVRDVWTQQMIEYISKGQIKPSITPDPVFAFNQNCNNFIPTKDELKSLYMLPDKYVLISMKCRMLHNKSYFSHMKELFKEQGFTCIALPMPTGVEFEHDFDMEIPCPLNPLDWYALIKYADGYVGENMHPIVVALHNAVPCFCFDTYGVLKYARLYCDESSSKIYDIMNSFDLGSNRINAYSRFWRRPDPEEIVQKITHFDRVRCRKKAAEKLNEYNDMMDTILRTFKYQK